MKSTETTMKITQKRWDEIFDNKETSLELVKKIHGKTIYKLKSNNEKDLEDKNDICKS